MLKPPKVGGAAQLRLFVDELGFDRSCQILEIHPPYAAGYGTPGRCHRLRCSTVLAHVLRLL